MLSQYHALPYTLYSHHTGHSHASHDHAPSHDHNHDHTETEKLITGHDHSHSNDSHCQSPTTSTSPPTAGYGSFTGANSPSHQNSAIEEYSHATEPSDVNIQAAYLHVMTDLIQSVGVAFAGLVIWYKPEWQIIDPICTFLFSGLVIWSTFSLLGRVVSILFEGVPAHVSSNESLSQPMHNISTRSIYCCVLAQLGYGLYSIRFLSPCILHLTI